MGYWEGDEWLDGPRLVAWADEHGYVPGNVSGSLSRRVTDWREGGRARFSTAEELVVALGFHPSELPEEVWADDQRWNKGTPRGRAKVAA